MGQWPNLGVSQLRVVTLSIFGIVICAGTAAADFLEGTLVVEDAIVVNGQISLASEQSRFLMMLEPRPPEGGNQPAQIFSTTLSEVQITEVRWPTILGDEPPRGPGIPDVRVVSDAQWFTSNHTRLGLIDVAPDSQWEVQTHMGMPSGSVVEVVASCQLLPIEADSGRAPSAQAPQGRRFHLGSTAVLGDCVIASGMIGGATEYYFFGSTFHLVDADGRDMTIRTGSFVEDYPLLPGVPGQRVDRVLEVRTRALDTVFVPPAGARAKIVSPAFVTAGEMQIPNTCSGHLQWGGQEFREGFEALAPHGAFVFSAPGDQSMVVTGSTLNGPLQAESKGLPTPAAVDGAVALALVALGAASAVVAWRYRVVVVGLFSRIESSAVLRNPIRGTILEIVRQDPGLSVSEISRRIGLGYTRILHHVSTLGREDLVLVRRLGIRLIVFPQGMSPQLQEPVAALRIRSVRLVVDRLVASPGVSQGEIARALGLSQARVCQVFALLEKRGWLRVERTGHRPKYAILSPLLELAIARQDSPLGVLASDRLPADSAQSISGASATQVRLKAGPA